MSAQTQPTSLAFSLIADYAIRQGWTPIGFRSFTVGPWTVTVNGTKTQRDGISPFHAHIAHDEIVALMVINPFGGSAGGWDRTEDEFIAAMQSALVEAQPSPEAPGLGKRTRVS